MTIPPSEEVLNKLVKEVAPEKIHLLNCGNKLSEPAEFLKILSGMLKYCASHNAGKIEALKSIAYLSCTQKAFDYALELLANCSIINIREQNENCCMFEFLESKPLSVILNNEKYPKFATELSRINEFREIFQSCDIGQIEELLVN